MEPTELEPVTPFLQTGSCASLTIVQACAGARRYAFGRSVAQLLLHSAAAPGLARSPRRWRNNVAFALVRYGGLFEDGSNEAVDRLDALPADRPNPKNVGDLRRF